MNKAYIDEECIMCLTYGKFISNRSSDVLIMKQSELSIEDIKRDEIVYFRNNKKFYGAEAFIQSTSDLGGIYKTVILFKVFPKYFRDVAYKFVAANRHKIFKKN